MRGRPWVRARHRGPRDRSAHDRHPLPTPTSRGSSRHPRRTFVTEVCPCAVPSHVLMALLLATMIAAPAQAAIPSGCSSSFGTSGSSAFTLFAEGNGSMKWALKGLKKLGHLQGGRLSRQVRRPRHLGRDAELPPHDLEGDARGEYASRRQRPRRSGRPTGTRSLGQIPAAAPAGCGVMVFPHVTRVRMPPESLHRHRPGHGAGAQRLPVLQRRDVQRRLRPAPRARVGRSSSPMPARGCSTRSTPWKAGKADNDRQVLLPLHADKIMHKYRITSWARGLEPEAKVTSPRQGVAQTRAPPTRSWSSRPAGSRPSRQRSSAPTRCRTSCTAADPVAVPCR